MESEPERVKAINRKYHDSHREQRNQVSKEWRQANPGQVWIAQRDDNRTLGQPSTAGEARPMSRRDFNTLSQTDYENRLGWPDQTGDANYEIVDRSNGNRIMVFIANTEQDALRKYEQWLDVAMLPHDTENYGFRVIAIPGSTIDLQRQRAAAAAGNVTNPLWREPQSLSRAVGREFVGWSVRLPTGEEVSQIHGIGNNQGDANRIAAQWLRDNGYGVSGEGYEVVPIWREA